MNGTFSAIAFLLGAGTSIVSGYVGMLVATYANARVALQARHGVADAFMTAFRAGAVMGFSLSGLGLLMLFIGIMVYFEVFSHNYYGVYEAITGYGLGGSSIALFGRVGGGIYTKAADVGADLVGKVCACSLWSAAEMRGPRSVPCPFFPRSRPPRGATRALAHQRKQRPARERCSWGRERP